MSIHTDRLDHITAHGSGFLPRKIRLADDAVISVRAGNDAWCTPRPRDRMVHEGGLGTAPADYPGPYTAVEVALVAPLTAPESWAEHEDFGIYSTVPVELVRALVIAHGGEHVAQDEWDDVVKAMGEGYVQDVRRA
jgi:hypothetical protein